MSNRTRKGVAGSLAANTRMPISAALDEIERSDALVGGATDPVEAAHSLPHPTLSEIGSGDASGGGHAYFEGQKNYAASNIDEIGVREHSGVDRATLRLNANGLLPDSANNQIGHSDVPGGRGHHEYEHQKAVAPSANIAELAELQKQRRFCIVSQSMMNRRCESFIARFLGYHADLSDVERKAIWKQATAMRAAVERGGEGLSSFDDQRRSALSVCVPIILNSQSSRSSWDSLRNQTERRMIALAKMLPCYPWAKQVKGFGEKSLAIIIGETGDLANYATKERVWKRLGLAVIEGERQQRRSNVEQAAAHGYNPKRRAEIWTIADSMLKHQTAGDKDGSGGDPKKSKLPIAVPAHPTGPYGGVYYRRKAHTATREWTPKHRDNDARRIMTKALVEDLWRVWRGLEPLGSKLGENRVIPTG